MPYTSTLSIGEDIPNISDPTKYCVIIACTVTVQLPMRVLHGVLPIRCMLIAITMTKENEKEQK